MDEHHWSMGSDKVRYFAYNDYLGDDPENNVVIVISEDVIKKTYWPYWYQKMCDKYGKVNVDARYHFEHCLMDWAAVNWAWPVKNPPRISGG